MLLVPPFLWQGDVFGHVAFSRFEALGNDIRMDCGPVDKPATFAHTRHDLFATWDEGEKGDQGDPAGWGSLRWNSYIGNHFMCGDSSPAFDPNHGGISYCQGSGGPGKWENHLVSISFWSQHPIGCNGEEIDGQMRVWHRRPICANGNVEGGEQCDDGNLADGDGCTATCQVE